MLARLRAVRLPTTQWALVAVGGYLIWVLLAPSSQLLAVIGSLGSLALRALAAGLFLRSAGAQATERARRSWRFMAAGVALWAASSGAVVLLRVAHRSAPALPSLPDLLGLAGSLAILSGVATYRHPERFGRLREFLDNAILVLALGALTWLVLLRTALRVQLADPIALMWAGVAPALDLIAAGLLGRQVLRSDSSNEAVTFGMFTAAALASAAADLGDGYRRIQGQRLADGLVELAWMIAAVLFIEVARRSARRRVRAGAPPRIAARLEALLPIALTYAVVGSAVVDWWANQQPDWLVIGASGVLSLLLMARQGVIAGQIEMRQYAALVNASADLSFVCDADGLVLLANPAFAHAIGSKPEAMVGTDLKSYFSEAGFQRTLKGALDHGWSGEAHLLDGQVPIYLSLRPVQDERRSRPLLAGAGVDLRVIKRRESELEAALREIADARRDLEQLNRELERKVEERTGELAETIADLARVNEELQELDRMKTEFVALVSHELRTPLTNIRSGLELVLERHPEMHSSVEQSLTLVHRETKRLSALVEAIMDLSALEAGRFPLQAGPVNLGEIVREVAEQFPDLAQLVIQLPDDLPPARADPSGLKSVLYHLLDNASKYAPEGDLTLEAAADDGSIQIRLTDSGPGIPNGDRERVFEMFHRLDSRDSREIYGHGLGLPMAKRLIEAMGGQIWAEPSPEQGARFVIRLPEAETS